MQERGRRRSRRELFHLPESRVLPDTNIFVEMLFDPSVRYFRRRAYTFLKRNFPKFRFGDIGVGSFIITCRTFRVTNSRLSMFVNNINPKWVWLWYVEVKLECRYLNEVPIFIFRDPRTPLSFSRFYSPSFIREEKAHGIEKWKIKNTSHEFHKSYKITLKKISSYTYIYPTYGRNGEGRRTATPKDKGWSKKVRGILIHV